MAGTRAENGPQQNGGGSVPAGLPDGRAGTEDF